MAKNKGYDVIADAHERANHNINPYYWTNRVTSFTVAQWRTEKYFAPLFFVIYTTVGTFVLIQMNMLAKNADKTFWTFLFDLSDAAASARFASFIMVSIYWIIASVSTIQTVARWFHAPASMKQPERRKEKKKKHPKRPKNYK